MKVAIKIKLNEAKLDLSRLINYPAIPITGNSSNQVFATTPSKCFCGCESVSSRFGFKVWLMEAGPALILNENITKNQSVTPKRLVLMVVCRRGSIHGHDPCE